MVIITEVPPHNYFNYSWFKTLTADEKYELVVKYGSKLGFLIFQVDVNDCLKVPTSDIIDNVKEDVREVGKQTMKISRTSPPTYWNITKSVPKSDCNTDYDEGGANNKMDKMSALALLEQEFASPKCYLANIPLKEKSKFYTFFNSECFDPETYYDGRQMSFLMTGEYAEGIMFPTIYYGEPLSFFPCHVEDTNCGGLNLSLSGRKVWIVFPPREADRLQKLINIQHRLFSSACKCINPFRHKMIYLSLAFIKANKLSCTIIEQKPGDLVYVLPRAFHQGLNITTSLNIAMNVAPIAMAEITAKAAICAGCKDNPSSSGFVLDQRVLLFLELGNGYEKYLDHPQYRDYLINNSELTTEEKHFLNKVNSFLLGKSNDLVGVYSEVRELYEILKRTPEDELICQYAKLCGGSQKLRVRIKAFLGVSVQELTFQISHLMIKVRGHTTYHVIQSILLLAGGIFIPKKLLDNEINHMVRRLQYAPKNEVDLEITKRLSKFDQYGIMMTYNSIPRCPPTRTKSQSARAKLESLFNVKPEVISAVLEEISKLKFKITRYGQEIETTYSLTSVDNFFIRLIGYNNQTMFSKIKFFLLNLQGLLPDKS